MILFILSFKLEINTTANKNPIKYPNEGCNTYPIPPPFANTGTPINPMNK